MSAINAIVTATAAHMIVDGLCYNDGKVTEVDAQKAFLLRGMRAAVAATGDAKTGYFLQAAINDEFDRFDDLVSAGSAFFVDAFRAFARRFCGGNAVSNVVLVGWLERENRPAAFGIDLVEGLGQWKGISGCASDAQNGVLAELPIIASPCPSLEKLLAAKYPLGSRGDGVKPEANLLHMMEIQRRMQANDGNYYVGGHAMLTTVTADGVTQRVVHRWPEDQPGKRIEPASINWATWRATSEKPSGSWLKRQMLERKARKQAATVQQNAELPTRNWLPSETLGRGGCWGRGQAAAVRAVIARI